MTWRDVALQPRLTHCMKNLLRGKRKDGSQRQSFRMMKRMFLPTGPQMSFRNKIVLHQSEGTPS